MKKKNQYYSLIVSFVFLLGACDSYLDHDLGDQLTLEETFSKRASTEKYLNHVYSFILDGYNPHASNTGSFTSLSDEAYFSWLAWVDYPNHNSGAWSPANTQYHYWAHYYRGIHQATIFMENVIYCKELSENEIRRYKAEARFLRAYYYFRLVEQYGPIYIWYDQMPDKDIDGATIDRMPLDDCTGFILSELDIAAEDLFDQKVINDTRWYGRVTYGAALAVKSRLALYVARPLFNGCPWYVGMKNNKGELLFPQTADNTKWEKAALAAKAIIDLGDKEGVYMLMQGTEDDLVKRAIKGYSRIFFDQWNRELIFARWETAGMDWGIRAAPSVVLNSGYAGYAPSLKLVDTYPMAMSGRFPMKSGEGELNPEIDPMSGFSLQGFTENWVNPADAGGKPLKVHNSCMGRDGRFYASVLFNGMFWINDANGAKKVTFYKKGTSPFLHQSGDFSKVGFLFRRMSNPNLNTEAGSWGSYTWSLFRYGEMYLNYAEAWKMMDPAKRAGLPSGLDYWDKIRARAGLNTIQQAYPEINFTDDSETGKNQYMDLLLKERMVEMAFENVRYFDVRTWMKGMQESNGPRYGLNLNAETYEASWNRSGSICSPIVCERKHHLFPIMQGQLNEMKNITQNYGW
jgi:hypothetical protein